MPACPRGGSQDGSQAAGRQARDVRSNRQGAAFQPDEALDMRFLAIGWCFALAWSHSGPSAKRHLDHGISGIVHNVSSV
eukprot:gene13501-biopygen15592